MVEGTEKIIALLYADDLVIICENEQALSEIMMRLEEVTQAWGLTISVKKTKQLIMINEKKKEEEKATETKDNENEQAAAKKNDAKGELGRSLKKRDEEGEGETVWCRHDNPS